MKAVQTTGFVRMKRTREMAEEKSRTLDEIGDAVEGRTGVGL